MGCSASSAAAASRVGAQAPEGAPGGEDAHLHPHLSAFSPVCDPQPFEQRCFAAVRQVIERHRLKPLSASTPEDERGDLLRTLLATSRETSGRIPHCMRAYCYQILSGGAELAVNYAGLYRTLLRMGPAEEEVDVVIRRDAGRSMPSMPFFGSRTRPGPGQPQLYRVLTAYCHLDPGVGYVQGCCMLAAMLLLVGLSEEATFFAFSSIMIRGGLRLLYAPGLPLTFTMYSAISGILQRKKPRLARALEDAFIMPALYATPWVLSGFVSSPLPVSSGLTILDALMAELAPILSAIPPIYSEAYQAAVVRTAPLSPIAAAEAFLGSPSGTASTRTNTNAVAAAALSTTKTAIIVSPAPSSGTKVPAEAGPATIASAAGETSAVRGPGQGQGVGAGEGSGGTGGGAVGFELNKYDEAAEVELPAPEDLVHSTRRYPGNFSYEVPSALLKPPSGKHYGGALIDFPGAGANGGKQQKPPLNKGTRMGASGAASSWWGKLRDACRLRRASLHRTPSPADLPGGIYTEGNDAVATSALVRGGAVAAAARRRAAAAAAAGEHLRGFGSGHHFPLAASASSPGATQPVRPAAAPAPPVVSVCLGDIPLSYLQSTLYLILVHEPAIMKAAYPDEDYERALEGADAAASSSCSGRGSGGSNKKPKGGTKHEKKLLAAAVDAYQQEQQKAKEEQDANSGNTSGAASEGARPSRGASVSTVSTALSSSGFPVSMEPDAIYARLKDEYDAFPWAQDPSFLLQQASSPSRDHVSRHDHQGRRGEAGETQGSLSPPQPSPLNDGGLPSPPLPVLPTELAVGLTSPPDSVVSAPGDPGAAHTAAGIVSNNSSMASVISGVSGLTTTTTTTAVDQQPPSPASRPEGVTSGSQQQRQLSSGSIVPPPRVLSPSTVPTPGAPVSFSAAEPTPTSGAVAAAPSPALPPHSSVIVLGGDYKKPSPSPLAALSSFAGGIVGSGTSSTSGGQTGPFHHRRSSSGASGVTGLPTPGGAVAAAFGAAGNAVLAAGGAVVTVAGAAGGLVSSAASLVASTVLPTPSSPVAKARGGMFSAFSSNGGADDENTAGSGETAGTGGTPLRRKGSVGGAGEAGLPSATNTASTTPKGGRIHARRGSSGGSGNVPGVTSASSSGGGGGSSGHALAIPIMTANEVALAQRLPSAPILPSSMHDVSESTPTFRLRPEQRFADFGAAASNRFMQQRATQQQRGDKTLPPSALRAAAGAPPTGLSSQPQHPRRGSFDDGYILKRRPSSSLRNEVDTSAATAVVLVQGAGAADKSNGNPNKTGATGGILFRDSARRSLGLHAAPHKEALGALPSVSNDDSNTGASGATGATGAASSVTGGGRPMSIGNNSSASTESGADPGYYGDNYRKEEEVIMAATARYGYTPQELSSNPNTLHTRTRSALAATGGPHHRPESGYLNSSYPTNATAASEWAYQQELIAMGLLPEDSSSSSAGIAVGLPGQRPVSASFSAYSLTSLQQRRGSRDENASGDVTGPSSHRRGSSSSSTSVDRIGRQRSQSDVARHVASTPTLKGKASEEEDGACAPDSDAKTSDTRVTHHHRGSYGSEEEEGGVMHASGTGNEGEEEQEEADVDEDDLHDHDDPDRRYRAVIALAAKSTRMNAVPVAASGAAEALENKSRKDSDGNEDGLGTTAEAESKDGKEAALAPAAADSTIPVVVPIVPILSAPPLPKHARQGKAAGQVDSNAATDMRANDFASVSQLDGGKPLISSSSRATIVPRLALAGAIAHTTVVAIGASSSSSSSTAATTARSVNISPAPTERMAEGQREGVAGTLGGKKTTSSRSGGAADGVQLAETKGSPSTTTSSSPSAPAPDAAAASNSLHAHSHGHRNHNTRHHHRRRNSQGLEPGTSSSGLVPLRIGSAGNMGGASAGNIVGGASSSSMPAPDYPPRGVHAPRRKAIFVASEGAKVAWPAEYEDVRTGKRRLEEKRSASAAPPMLRTTSSEPSPAGSGAAALAAEGDAVDTDDGRDIRARRRYADYSCDTQPCSVWALPSVLAYSLQHSELLRISKKDLAWIALYMESQAPPTTP